MAWCPLAYAQEAPTPQRPTPRVPFTAFRMKPILDPRLDAKNEALKASGSLVVPDKKAEEVRAVPKPKSLGTLPVARPKPVVTPPVQLRVQTVETPRDQTPDLPQNIPLPQETQNARIPAGRPIQPGDDVRVTASGLPLPQRKPDAASNADRPFTPERLLAQPPTEATPVVTTLRGADVPEADVPELPQPPEEGVAVIVPPKPVSPEELSAPSTVRIRDGGGNIIGERVNRSRFSSQSRTAGLSLDSGSSRSADLPEELRNIRIGRLEEADGISPISIPGLKRASIPRAPEIARAAEQKNPPEVIVFFQENSDELEVGQLEILQEDVVGLLKKRRDLDVEIVGYADAPDGDRDGAKRLSQARALMIRDYLVRQKIDGSRLDVTVRANDTRIEPRDRADLFFSR